MKIRLALISIFSMLLISACGPSNTSSSKEQYSCTNPTISNVEIESSPEIITEISQVNPDSNGERFLKRISHENYSSYAPFTIKISNGSNVRILTKKIQKAIKAQMRNETGVKLLNISKVDPNWAENTYINNVWNLKPDDQVFVWRQLEEYVSFAELNCDELAKPRFLSIYILKTHNLSGIYDCKAKLDETTATKTQVAKLCEDS
ncbi:MAG: hypothetical protein RLZZ330_1043 [Actinomycetota bacterium]|jgi:hypothetical protein